MALLSPERIRALYQQALELGLCDSREALLSSMPSVKNRLLRDAAPARQLVLDLNALNDMPAQVGSNSTPLEIWLETAIHLVAFDPRCEYLRDALKELRSPKPAGAPAGSVLQVQAPSPPKALVSASPSGISLKELLPIENNERNFDKLLEQVHSQLPIVPFVGAGLSMPCGMPGWRAFIEKAAKGALEERAILEHLDEGDFESAAEVLSSSLGKRAFEDEIDAAFGRKRVESATLKGAVLLMPSFAKGPVVTTNFDRVLERVFKEQGREFEERVWGARVNRLASALHENKPFLLKIHGDAIDIEERVLTLSDYAHYYGSAAVDKIDLQKPLPKVLEQLFCSRTLLFLGCSLENDRTVRLIKHVETKRAGSPVHYAIVELPGTPLDIKKRQQFLSNHNIRPLFFPPGKFEGIEVFLQGLLKAPGR